MKLTCPLLVVKDLSLSRKFYETVLSQKVVANFGENITFNGGFALQSLKSWADFIETPPKTIVFGGRNFELYFENFEFNNFIKHLQTFENIKYVHDVKQHDWGQRVVRFYDLDENIIEVGESMKAVICDMLRKGISVELVAQKTMFPIKLIQRYKKNI